MKIINKYILGAMAGCLFAFTSCSDDIVREPSPAVDPNCQGAYFVANDQFDSDENSYSYELEPEAAQEITLTVGRSNTTDAATVGIEVLTNTENMFEVPASVSFDAGQAETSLTIPFPNAEIGVSYNLALKLAEGDYNPYADASTHIICNVIRIKWNPFDTAIYTDGMVSTVYGVDYPLTWTVDAEWAEFPDGSMRVRLNNPYREAFNVTSDGIYDGYPYIGPDMVTNPNVKLQINIDSNKTKATMDVTYLGFFLNESDGELLGGTAYGLFQGTEDNYPLGVVKYDKESEQLESIIFGPNSLFASVESLWAGGRAGIASNPTTLFFSYEAYQEYLAGLEE